VLLEAPRIASFPVEPLGDFFEAVKARVAAAKGKKQKKPHATKKTSSTQAPAPAPAAAASSSSSPSSSGAAPAAGPLSLRASLAQPLLHAGGRGGAPAPAPAPAAARGKSASGMKILEQDEVEQEGGWGNDGGGGGGEDDGGGGGGGEVDAAVDEDGTQFTCFTGTKVPTLTVAYKCKSTNTDAEEEER
jgi:hypothetical protein